MDQWTAHEMKAAPDLEPSPEVYQKLKKKRKKARFVLFSWPIRLAAAGIAAALITLLIVLQPPKEVGPFVGLRKGTFAEKAGRGESRDEMQVVGEAEPEEQIEDVGKTETAKMQKRVEEGIREEGVEKKEYEEPPAKKKILEKMKKAKEADKEVFVQPKEVAARSKIEIAPEKKEAKSEVKMSRIAAAAPAIAVSERVEFQYQPKGSESIKRLDMDSLQDEIISLSSEDNYRLKLQLPQERYVYVFQIGADEQAIRLFPNTEYNPSQNPLQAGKTIMIPLPPNWFYVEKDQGEVLIYVVTSAESLQDWDALYAKFSQTSKTKKKQKISAALLERIKNDKTRLKDQVSIRVFEFMIH